MRLFRELVRSHSGAAIVIGGGPSAPSDFAIASAAYPDAIHISANQHGFMLPGARCKYAVHVDAIHQHYQQPMHVVLRRPGVELIGKFDFDDYMLVDWRYGGDSGMMALIVAQMLGAAPVLPCGFDRWAGKKPGGVLDFYFHDMGGRHWPGPPSAPNLKRHVEMAGTKTIRAISGKMLDFWPRIGVAAEPNITPLGEYQACQLSSRPTRPQPIMPTDHRRHAPAIRVKKHW
jgi:hypothetical protein